MILVTGGCGYIGSHCIVELLNNGENVISIDDLSNSQISTVHKIKNLTGKSFKFIKCDTRNKTSLDKIFQENKIKTIIHFAGLKSISMSNVNSNEYFSVNVNGTINILELMKKYKVNELIFSSSATVYGDNHPLPWKESLMLQIPKSVYAKTKFFTENILKDFSISHKDFKIGCLRYFNPIGCHKSGKIGENIYNKNNLIPAILRVNLGIQNSLNVYGNDFNTYDGTGIRDYIHINDLIIGHLKAMKYISNKPGFHVWNLGSGKGYSVLEVIESFEKILEKKINYSIQPRRKGDIGSYWADPTKAYKELNWKTTLSIEEMARDIITFGEKLSLD